MTTTTTSTRPHETIWTLTNSIVAGRAIQVVAELGVADQVGDTPISAGELARRCDLHPTALDRVLRLLVAHRVFALAPTGYVHTDASRVLRSDHPQSMRGFARMMGLPVFWGMFGALDHSLRTGAPGMETIDSAGLWSYLQAHPGEARIFDEAMRAKSRADVAAVVDAYDFRPFGTIADIGGGQGHLLDVVLTHASAARGVLFELPAVIESLPSPSDRMTYTAGDFFVDGLPVADAYILMEIIHDWPDDEALAILRAIRAAAAPGAVVLIVEGIVPDGEPDPRVQTLDVIMLVVTGGRERTAGDFGALLAAAGFRKTAVLPTAGPMQIVEAVAV
jgi:O-methyltransferase